MAIGLVGKTPRTRYITGSVYYGETKKELRNRETEFGLKPDCNQRRIVVLAKDNRVYSVTTKVAKKAREASKSIVDKVANLLMSKKKEA